MAKNRPPYGIAQTILTVVVVFGIIIVLSLMLLKRDACSHFNDALERDQCYADTAIASKSLGGCQKVQASSFQDYCVIGVIKETGDLNSLQSLSSKKQGYVLSSLATQKNDTNMCLSIQDTDWRDVCYDVIARQTSKYDLCRYVQNKLKRDDCYDSIGHSTLSAQACSRIIDDEKFLLCTADVGIGLRDVTICKSILKPNIQAMCINKIAFLENDTSLCNQIGSAIITEDCKRTITKKGI